MREPREPLEFAERVTALLEAAEPLAEFGKDLRRRKCHLGISTANECARCRLVLRLRTALRPCAWPRAQPTRS